MKLCKKCNKMTAVNMGGEIICYNKYCGINTYDDLLKREYYRHSKPLTGAYRKGIKAFMDGKPCKSPYKDCRTWRGAVTWSRSFVRAWIEGWQDAEKLSKGKLR